MSQRPLFFAVALAAAAPMAPLRAQGALFTADRYLALEQASSPVISPDGKTILFVRRTVDQRHDRWMSTIWSMDADGGSLRPVADGTNPRWSPDGTRIAYLAEVNGASQLFVRYADGAGPPIQVTVGAESPSAFAWAPDGQSLAFTGLVPESSQWTVPVPAAPAGAQWTPPPRVVDQVDFRADGEGYLRDGWVQLFVVPAWGGATRQLTYGTFNVGARAVGLPEAPTITWMPDGKSIVVDGNDAPEAALQYLRSNLYTVDLASGAERRLTPDSGWWHAPAVSPDGKWIAYVGTPATRALYHTSAVYVMHPDGSGVRNLTSGFDRDPASLRWAPDNQTIWFQAQDHGSVNLYTTSLDPKKGGAKPATNGTHVLSLGDIAAKNDFGVVARSAPSEPADIYSFPIKKPWQLQQLTHLNDNALAGVALGDMEEVDYNVGETAVQGWVIKPPGFDPQKKYPLILEIHGGPTSMYTVGFNASFQNFAANGYVVLFVNPRGSTGYGSAFGNAIADNYPGVDYDDLMGGVNEVIGRGWVDTDPDVRWRLQRRRGVEQLGHRAHQPFCGGGGAMSGDRLAFDGGRDGHPRLHQRAVRQTVLGGSDRVAEALAADVRGFGDHADPADGGRRRHAHAGPAIRGVLHRPQRAWRAGRVAAVQW